MSKRQRALAAIDAWAVALASGGHVWTNAERRAYERAVRALKP